MICRFIATIWHLLHLQYLKAKQKHMIDHKKFEELKGFVSTIIIVCGQFHKVVPQKAK